MLLALAFALLAFAYTLWAIAGAGYEVVFKGFLLLMAGIPVYVWMRWQTARGDTSGMVTLDTGADAGDPGGNGHGPNGSGDGNAPDAADLTTRDLSTSDGG